MGIFALLLVLTILANLALSLLVLLRDYRNRVGQTFFVMATCINIWAVSNYITSNASSVKTSGVFNHLAFLFAFQALFWASVFTNIFLNKKYKVKPLSLPINGVVVVGISVLSFFSIIAGNVTKQNGSLAFSSGSLLWLYILVLVFYTALVIRNFYLTFKNGNFREKNQARLMILGFSAGILLGIITNALVPLITSNWNTASLGPILVSFFIVSSVSYAIIKHRLFDIRAFVVRAAAYTLTLTCITLIYIGPTVFFANYLLHNNLRTTNLAILVVITIIVAFLFQPLRNYFNKLTNKIFYRDYYDPQVLLDQLGGVIVGSIEVDHIINRSSDILKKSMKPHFIKYELLARKDKADREFLKSLFSASKGILATDEIDRSDKTLYNTLLNDNVALSVCLRTKHEDIGFILMGYKQSGGIYTETDKRILGVAADEIAISLQNALRFEEIQNFNKTLQEKIALATLELQHANSKLKQLDAAKDDFISMASHQLRTPLTSIKGYLSMVVDGDAGRVTSTQKEFLIQALTSSQKMANLVSDLLNVSRLQSGKFTIDYKPVNLANVTDETVKELAKMASIRGIKLSFTKPIHFPPIMLDEDKTGQVIMNFIDNAIHYSKENGHIDVGLTEQSGIVKFTVKDDGIGVPAAVQKHLFTKFFRADNAKKARPDGTGIGLYLAKQVIDIQGGTLIFESQEHKGSTFGFTFSARKSLPIKNHAKFKKP